MLFFYFKQKTAYEMRISDWSSDVCYSDLEIAQRHRHRRQAPRLHFLDDGGRTHGRLDVGRDFLHVRPGHAIGGENARPRRGRETRKALFGDIGRASWTESVYQTVYISVVTVALKKIRNSTTLT